LDGSIAEEMLRILVAQSAYGISSTNTAQMEEAAVAARDTGTTSTCQRMIPPAIDATTHSKVKQIPRYIFSSFTIRQF
jgi:hypothetical protein